MADTIDEPDQLDIIVPPYDPTETPNMIESNNAHIWYEHSVLEYVLLFISIAIILIFLIPFSIQYYVLIYFASIISYAIVIFFVYYWSVRNDMRDIRLMLIFFVFALVLSQLFQYYTTDDVLVIMMYVISLAFLLYIIVRGWKTPFVIALIVPLAFIISQIVVQVLNWVS